MKKKLPLEFGEKLRMIREQRGFKVSELADMVGVTQGYISKLELGIKKDPSWKVVEALANALNVPTDVFREDNEDIWNVPMYSIIDHLPPHLQEFVLSQKNIPMLDAARYLVELDLSPEAVKLYVEALSKVYALSHNVKK